MNALNQFLSKLVIPREGQGLGVAVAVSLLLHVLMLSLLFKVSLGPDREITPTTVSVRLVSNNKLRLPSEAENSVTLQEERESLAAEPLVFESDQLSVIIDTDTSLVRSAPELSDTAERVEAGSTIPVTETTAPVEPDDFSEGAGEFAPPRSNSEIELPQVVLPSSSDVARSLRVIEQQDQNASRLWTYDCSPLQRASELIVCDDSRVSENFSRARHFDSQNAITSQIYQRFNPAPELSRGQRSLPTISREASGLAARLATAAIPEDLRKYLNAEIEAGITHNVNQGGVAAEMLDRLVNQSDAAQIVRESRNDPWIKRRTRSRMSVGN